MSDKPLRLIELFAGYGSQALALKRLNIPFEHYKVVEFDKYAIKSYNALHDTNFETQDIKNLETLDIKDTEKYNYLVTYSFPCQDISVAGRQKGMSKGEGTRSGLLWEFERLLLETEELPQMLLMENVPAIHWKKNIDDFNEWINFLETLGYTSKWQDLNAKYFNIPQNRNRTFLISTLDERDFSFPKQEKITAKLKDFLEENVDIKYYLTKNLIDFFVENTKKQKERGNGFKFEPRDGKGIAKSITTKSGSRMDDNFIKVVGTLNTKGNEQINRVYDEKGLSPTLNTMQGGNRQPKILIPEKIKKGYKEAYDGDGMRIRKLTPKECFRLMGLNDDEIEIMLSTGNSNAQLYKQAGNSIVVNVLEEIFKNLLKRIEGLLDE